MSTSLPRKVFATALALGGALTAGCAHAPAQHEPKADVGFVVLDADITLRRLVVRHPDPQGTVLLLHGFPETVYAWRGIALELGRDYEVHAIDWPGYGLSSRPPVQNFSYAPADYARVLKDYIAKARIARSSLAIYATDIGALPALLLALQEPGIARNLIVGDFAPFDRPGLMYESLRNLKSPQAAEQTRAYMNANREEILENVFHRGLAPDARFDVPQSFRDDAARSWDHGEMTTADAFFHYYAHFTRDQRYFEAQVAQLRTPVKVLWGEDDLYIHHAMGAELAEKANAPFALLPGIGHYPHLQDPRHTVDEIRASFR